MDKKMATQTPVHLISLHGMDNLHGAQTYYEEGLLENGGDRRSRDARALCHRVCP